MDTRDTEFYKGMDTFLACSIVEGFSGEEHTEEEIITAWQWLYDCQAYRWLQGFYGRAIRDLLDEGVILE